MIINGNGDIVVDLDNLNVKDLGKKGRYLKLNSEGTGVEITKNPKAKSDLPAIHNFLQNKLNEINQLAGQGVEINSEAIKKLNALQEFYRDKAEATNTKIQNLSWFGKIVSSSEKLKPRQQLDINSWKDTARTAEIADVIQKTNGLLKLNPSSMRPETAEVSEAIFDSAFNINNLKEKGRYLAIDEDSGLMKITTDPKEKSSLSEIYKFIGPYLDNGKYKELDPESSQKFYDLCKFYNEKEKSLDRKIKNLSRPVKALVEKFSPTKLKGAHEIPSRSMAGITQQAQKKMPAPSEDRTTTQQKQYFNALFQQLRKIDGMISVPEKYTAEIAELRTKLTTKLLLLGMDHVAHILETGRDNKSHAELSEAVMPAIESMHMALVNKMNYEDSIRECFFDEKAAPQYLKADDHETISRFNKLLDHLVYRRLFDHYNIKGYKEAFKRGPNSILSQLTQAIVSRDAWNHGIRR